MFPLLSSALGVLVALAKERYQLSHFLALSIPFLAFALASLFVRRPPRSLPLGEPKSASAPASLFICGTSSASASGPGILGIVIFFLGLVAGRLARGPLLRRMQPQTLFLGACLLSLLSLLGLFVSIERIAIASFLLIGLGFANIRPSISSTELTGTLIAGGALLPPAMGWLGSPHRTPKSANFRPK